MALTAVVVAAVSVEVWGADAANLVVRSTAGHLAGTVHEGRARAWLGIPFAAPPTGGRRWRKPAPVVPWEGVRPADAFGDDCAQPDAGSDSGVRGSEDCLYLNVYAPLAAPDQALPVMVWIHGGGQYSGTAAAYDGSHLVKRHDVVVVTVNYRLGPFGWFHHPAITTPPSGAATTGQFALLDIVSALEWVRDNAAAFGGDPDNVTVFGESAGAHNVYALMLAPRAWGLFHKLIAQSGGFWNMSLDQAVNYQDDPVPGTPASAREIVAALLVERRRAIDIDAARRLEEHLAPDRLARWLRNLDARTLLEPYRNQPNLGYDLPSVIYDGRLLPREAHETLLTEGEHARVPMITGANRDEQRRYLFDNPEFVVEEGGVTRRRNPARYQALDTAYSGWWNYYATDYVAEALARHDVPVYAYRFDWDDQPTAPSNWRALIGAAHGLELPFVFGEFRDSALAQRSFTAENRPGRLGVSEAMMSYWAAFAWHGDPGRGRDGLLPHWQPWAAGGRKLLLDTPGDGGIRMARAPLNLEQLQRAVRCSPHLSYAEKCEIIKYQTMYPSYDQSVSAASRCSPP